MIDIQELNSEEKIGLICMCQKGTIGVIEEVKIKDGEMIHFGTKIFNGSEIDGTPWQSKHPRIIALSEERYVDNKMAEFKQQLAKKGLAFHGSGFREFVNYKLEHGIEGPYEYTVGVKNHSQIQAISITATNSNDLSCEVPNCCYRISILRKGDKEWQVLSSKDEKIYDMLRKGVGILDMLVELETEENRSLIKKSRRLNFLRGRINFRKKELRKMNLSV